LEAKSVSTSTKATPAEVFSRVIQEGFNEGKLASLSEIVAPDLIENQVGANPGVDGLRALITSLRDPFPDLRLEIESTVTEGDVFWARIRARGTNTGPLRGTPPSGRSMDITVIDIARVVNGRLVEHWGVADRLTMLTQMGISIGHQPS
jgi:predicted ester cyclase